MRITLLMILCGIFIAPLFGQELPDDFLSSEFHKDRREALRKKLPKNSVAVMFANPVRNRANDVDFIYHQDPNFYYLTGYKEPHSILLIFSEDQKEDGQTFNEILFAQARDARMEMWNGRRLGVKGVKEKLGFNMVKDHREFKEYALSFNKFSKVLFIDFHNDIRDNPRDEADLYDLKKQFKEKARIPADFNATTNRMYASLQDPGLDFQAKKRMLYSMTRWNPRALDDPIVREFMNVQDNEMAMKVAKKAPKTNLDAHTLPMLMGQLRETKTEEELVLLRKAVDISAIGQIEVMKAMHPEMSETEVQGIHEFVFKNMEPNTKAIHPSLVEEITAVSCTTLKITSPDWEVISF